MKRIYAESTLRKKYREIGLSKDVAWKLRVYLTACALFYRFAEADELWQAILKTENAQAQRTIQEKMSPAVIQTTKALLAYEDETEYDVRSEIYIKKLADIAEKLICPMKPMPTRDQFDAFLRAEEHGAREYVVFEDSDIYLDGIDGPCSLAYRDILLKTAKADDGTDCLEIDYDRLWRLEIERREKTQYIPDDLLCYADPDYIPETRESQALLDWMAKIPLSRADAEDVLYELREIVFDADPVGKEKQAIECLNRRDVVFRSTDEAFEYIALFDEFHNHTRMPIHKGHLPSEIRREPQRLPSGIQFSPGLQEAIRRGDIKGGELKAKIRSDTQLPKALKMSFASEVDKALAPNEERWVGTTLIKGKKTGPNDPCPCGSGKKYKKCCGKN